jgi:hypothetical protein
MEITARRCLAAVAFFCFFLSASLLQAQDYTREMKAMFDATSFDFGTVARGAKVEHRFTIENIYEEDIQILAVKSSCGCTTPQINKRLLKTWEKAELVAVVDTRNHTGQKDVVITVAFGGQFPCEVQIPVHVFIRGDIVVQPGSVQFGIVRQGKEAKQDVTINYAGRDNWQIQNVECASPYLATKLTEVSREPGTIAQNINYSLAVTLKADAPPGYFQSQLVLVTNDPNPRSARVPISVEGKIDAALSVSSQLPMGVATPGQPLTRSIVIKGAIPFHITSVQCKDERFECKPSDEAKTVHVIPVTFTATDAQNAAGTVKVKIRIETDMPGASPAEVLVSVQISPPKSRQP